MRSTVLLVDDEELLRRLLSRMLLGAGFTVIDADNGRRALELAAAVKPDICLAITDIHMPIMDGLEFAREFRPLCPSVPILFITGRDLPESSDTEKLDGDVLRKPFRTETFLEAVARLLSGNTRAPHPPV